MKVRPHPKTGSVIVVLTAGEAVRFAEQLVRAAVASGAPLEDEGRPEPTREEREG